MNQKKNIKVIVGICCMLAGLVFLVSGNRAGRDTEVFFVEAEQSSPAVRSGDLGQDRSVESLPYIEETEGPEAAGAAAADAVPSGTVVVHVCGAVASPGVYTLPEGSRAADAVAAAGGFLPEADGTYLNLAAPLTDGQQLRVLTEAETETAAAAGNAGAVSSEEASDGRININTATREELMQLPGIGAARADAILLYRQEHGDFADASEIMQVSGIKEASYEKLKGLIRTR